VKCQRIRGAGGEDEEILFPGPVPGPPALGAMSTNKQQTKRTIFTRRKRQRWERKEPNQLRPSKGFSVRGGTAAAIYGKVNDVVLNKSDILPIE